MAGEKRLDREAVGAHVAYDIDWHALGFSTVARAGGTVWLRSPDGREHRIVVHDVADDERDRVAG